LRGLGIAGNPDDDHVFLREFGAGIAKLRCFVRSTWGVGFRVKPNYQRLTDKIVQADRGAGLIVYG